MVLMSNDRVNSVCAFFGVRAELYLLLSESVQKSADKLFLFTIQTKDGRGMNRNKSVAVLMGALVVSVALVLSVGCSDVGAGPRLGVKIPADKGVVELSAIMQNPQQYNGKQVVMKGVISGQCASLCEFFFKDGVHKATIYPQGYAFPKLTVGKPVTVYAQVTAGEEQVVFSALGVAVE
jgi:hypothetical protein